MLCCVDEDFTMKKPKYVNKPFAWLPLKQRACAVLTMAGFTYREIEKLGISSRTIRRCKVLLSDDKIDKSKAFLP